MGLITMITAKRGLILMVAYTTIATAISSSINDLSFAAKHMFRLATASEEVFLNFLLLSFCLLPLSGTW